MLPKIISANKMPNVNHITVLDNCPDPIISISSKGEILYQNFSALDFIKKISKRNIIKKKYLDFIKSALKNKEARIEFEINGMNYRSILKYNIKEKTTFIYTRDITNRYKYEKEIEKRAYFDELTELPNKTLYRDRVNLALANAMRNEEVVAVLFVDLDNFKAVNDTMGHDAGDELLIKVSKRMSKCLRKSDTLSRLSGDEFSIVMPNIKSIENSINISKRIISALQKKFNIKGKTFFTSSSIGISYYPHDGKSFDKLLKNADTAMYSAKKSGKNQFKLFHEEMNVKLNKRVETEVNLHKAIRSKSFFLNFQPQYNLSNNSISGCESLLRLKIKDKTLMPSKFIDIAEKSELIIPIGHWLIEKSFSVFRDWDTNLKLKNFTLSINLSAKQLKDKNLITVIKKYQNIYKINTSNIAFEITESSIISDYDYMLSQIKSIKALGYKIYLDDFGTGYSSLSYLMSLPIDVVKIDKSFIKNINKKTVTIITNMIIEMCKKLDIDIIAEGVETKDQLSLLKQLYCNKIQGFYFSKPISIESFEKLINK